MKQLYAKLSARIRVLPDGARLTVQMTIGALAAFFAAAFTGLNETAWAVISAVFVVQGTMDSTLGSALWRVAGGAVGAMIGLACIFTIGTGGLLTVASLATGIILMGLIMARYPSLSFGLVTVVILVVSPGLGPVENAVERTAAIAIGGLVGVSVAAFVFRRRSANYAARETAAALKRSSTLLQQSVGTLFGGGAVDFREEHNDIARRLTATKDQLAETRRAPILDRRGASLDWDTVTAVESIWRTMPILTLAAQPLGAEAQRLLYDPTCDAARSLAADISALADSISGNAPPRWPERSNRAVDELARHADADSPSAFEGSGDDRLRVGAVVFGLDELRNALNGLAQALDVAPGNGREEQSIAEAA